MSTRSFVGRDAHDNYTKSANLLDKAHAMQRLRHLDDDLTRGVRAKGNVVPFGALGIHFERL